MRPPSRVEKSKRENGAREKLTDTIFFFLWKGVFANHLIFLRSMMLLELALFVLRQRST
jgi:hypothetical protein